MHWVPLEQRHLDAIVLQGAQEHVRAFMLEPGYLDTLRAGGPCVALQAGAEVLVCCGLMHLWENRSVAWSLIARDAGRHFVRIFRMMRAIMEQHPVRRVECTVDPGFENGHRLARMLGFEREGLMRAYLPDGRDVVQYARIR